MSAHYPVIYSARAMRRILANACLAGEDIDELEKKYIRKWHSRHDLVEVEPEDEDLIHNWDVQHTKVRSYPNPTSTEHYAAMIAATPHWTGRSRNAANMSMRNVSEEFEDDPYRAQDEDGARHAEAIHQQAEISRQSDAAAREHEAAREQQFTRQPAVSRQKAIQEVALDQQSQAEAEGQAQSNRQALKVELA